MAIETKNCQNCKAAFTLEQADFDFFKKMSVPAPTWCPECRMMRRYAWRNERVLYKAVCGQCKKATFSVYAPDQKAPVYCRECWISDLWDPMSYGQEYDFSRPFFEQLNELFGKVPRMNMFQVNSVNSTYANYAYDTKNAYLSYSMVGGEDIFYCKNVDTSRQMFDSLNGISCEQGYYDMYGSQNYAVIFSVLARSCLNSSFLFDCTNCQNCFMSANLRNKQYVFCCKQLTKEQYEAEMKKINMGSWQTFQKLIGDFRAMRQSALHRFANSIRCINSTGDVLTDLKNAHNCFEIYECEDVRYVGRSFGLKDCMDVNNNSGSELGYEYVSGGRGNKSLAFSLASLEGLADCAYTGWCGSSSDLFGCFGVRRKQYCILNKQYTKEEYGALLPKIKKHMDEMPYLGKNGRVYKFGEFFPIELSPIPYNNSVAQELASLTKAEIETRGYQYRDFDIKNPQIDIRASELPDDSALMGEDILQKAIGCEHSGSCVHQCTVAFKLTPQELAMYKRVKLPIPRHCPNCRHYERLTWRNPWHLWQGKCQCDGQVQNAKIKMQNGYQNTAKHFHDESHCPNTFETSYAPGRPETLYCEQCYNAEIV